MSFRMESSTYRGGGNEYRETRFHDYSPSEQRRLREGSEAREECNQHMMGILCTDKLTTTKQKVGRVVGCAVVGAGIGAGTGSLFAGIGSGPGAVIGALSGAGFGLCTIL